MSQLLSFPLLASISSLSTQLCDSGTGAANFVSFSPVPSAFASSNRAEREERMTGREGSLLLICLLLLLMSPSLTPS